MRCHLPPGKRDDTIGVEPSIKGIGFAALLADKAFEADWITGEMNERGARIVIPRRRRREKLLQIGAEVDKWRHLIENVLAILEEVKEIAMRSAKTDRNVPETIDPASAGINSPRFSI